LTANTHAFERWRYAPIYSGGSMPYVIGIALALIVSCFARLTGFDRDRAFYPTVAIVIALYYVLFAVMSGSDHALMVELLAMTAFVVAAVIGFKSSLWVVVGCLAAHGVFDVFHGLVVANPGVPDWWPGFCLTYDVGAAAFLAWLLTRSKLEPGPRRA
jgi:hypothetical protein